MGKSLNRKVQLFFILLIAACSRPGGKDTKDDLLIRRKGYLEKMLAEDFLSETTEVQYFLRSYDSKNTYSVRDNEAFHHIDLSHVKVQISALEQQNGELELEGILKTEALVSPVQKPEKGENSIVFSVAVVHVSFSDVQPMPYFSLDNLPYYLSEVEQGVEKYTQGQIKMDNYSMNGTTRDIFDITLDEYSSNSPCTTPSWRTDATEAVKNNYDVDLNDYQWVLYYMPKIPACNYSGLAGDRAAFIFLEQQPNGSGDKNVKTTLHEIGHILGLGHAGNDLNNDGLKDSEYGDYSSIMGGSTLPEAIVNSVQMIQLNLLDDMAEAVFAPSQSGMYGLSSLHVPSDKPRRRVLKTYSPIGDWYYISYRTDEINYSGPEDSYIPYHHGGIAIHREDISESNSNTVWVSNLKSPGDSFMDNSGMTIHYVSNENSFPPQAVVEIAYPFNDTWQSHNLGPIAYDTESHFNSPSQLIHFSFDDPDGPRDWTKTITKMPEHANYVNVTNSYISIGRESKVTTNGVEYYVGVDTIEWTVTDGVPGHIPSHATTTIYWE